MWQHSILSVKRCLTVNTHGTRVSMGHVLSVWNCRVARAGVLCVAWEALLGLLVLAWFTPSPVPQDCLVAPVSLQVDSLPAEPQGKPKNIGVGSLSLLQPIFPTQESNQGLLHCRRILYQLSYEGSPLSFILT